MARYHPLRELLLARARQFFREPETIFWVYFFPLLLMGGLGLAFRGQGEAAVRVEVEASDPATRQAIAGELERADGIEVVHPVEGTPRQRASAIDLTVAVSGAGPDAPIELRFDPSRPEARLARERVERVLRSAATNGAGPRIETASIDVPGTRYIDWLLPGLLGLNIMGGGLYGVGFVSVDMRIRKLLKRFRATPMRRSDFLLSLIGGRLLFLVPEITVILLVGWLVFGIEVRGDLVSVFTVGFAGAASFAGIGLLIASRARKIETMSGLVNLTMFPMWLLGDVFFAAERFPASMQPFLAALPLNRLNSALRIVILDGGSLVDAAPSLLIVILWGAVSFPLAIRLFRWQ